MITVEALCKVYPSPEGPIKILDNINFTLPKSASVAIMGASGSGKSTLLALLAGLDTPDSGRIALDGEEITTLDEDARAAVRNRTVGFVFQSFHLLGTMTALENVMLPLEIYAQDNVRERALAMLDNVGLAPRASHYPNQLSGGEQQRVALARAFVAAPSILFADEPTGNLDNKTAARVADLLFELNEKFETTLVLVTHDRSFAQSCERVVELVDANLIEES